MIKLSIVMPLKDCEEWINKCLNSIPDREDVEVIMVINGSTDNTDLRCTLKEYEHTKKYIYILKDAIGCADAYNYGVDRAHGEYVLQLDGDDYLFTSVIENILDNDLGADLVYFNLLDNTGKVYELSEETRRDLPDHTCLIKRSFLGDTRMPITEEDRFEIAHGLKFMNILLAKNHHFRFTNKVAYYYNFPRVNSLYWNAKLKGKENDIY